MTSDIKRHIKELISGSENSEVEFKSAKGGLPESFWETFSAFANTNGGIIVLGIKEKNGIFMPDGLNKFLFIVIILFTGQMYDKSGDKHYLPVILYKKVSASDK